LSLFGEPARGEPGSTDASGRLAAAHADAARFARLIPPSVRFGTSSWAFPGWAGLVYSRSGPQGVLAREGLREYARHPLLRTVGIDRTYYAPIPLDDLRRYADQLPDGFPCCCKAPASVTSPVRPGRRAAEPNPHFLSSDRFAAEVLEPVDRVFRDHAGPFILQFPPMLGRSAVDPAAFLEALDAFLAGLPRQYRYGVEVRDRKLLTAEYASVIARHGAAHIYNLWTRMPALAEQVSWLAPEGMPFVMARLLLRPGATYEEQREAFAPFAELRAPDETMRGQVADLVAQAVAHAIPAFVLVNNKAEGSAPLTIEALAECMAR